LPLMLTGDLGIEQEGVIASVPCDVDKADQAAAIQQASGHPAKAVGPDLVPPPGRGLAAMCSDKGHHFRVGDYSAPPILNRLERHMRVGPRSTPEASTSDHGQAVGGRAAANTAANAADGSRQATTPAEHWPRQWAPMDAPGRSAHSYGSERHSPRGGPTPA